MEPGLLSTCWGVEFLGHCGVQFRLTGVGSPLDPCGFGFGAFWGSVHADEIWSPPYLLGVEPGRLWGSIQAYRQWVTTGPMCFWLWVHSGVQFRLTDMGHHRTHVVSALGHFGVQFRLME